MLLSPAGTPPDGIHTKGMEKRGDRAFVKTNTQATGVYSQRN